MAISQFERMGENAQPRARFLPKRYCHCGAKPLS
jgi:hypothetical protein